MRKASSGAALAAILVLATVAVAIAQSPSPKELPVDYWQPLWMQRELWGPGTMPHGMRARLLRHTTYMQYGVQPEYQSAKSTVGNDKQTLEAGGKLYEQRCASCHGKQGMGDGDAPRSLLPSPALLAFMISASDLRGRVPSVVDLRGRQTIRYGDARIQGHPQP